MNKSESKYFNTAVKFDKALLLLLEKKSFEYIRFGYPTGERKYVLMFYLNGITAIITEWLKDGCQKSIDEISEIINYCIFGRESNI